MAHNPRRDGFSSNRASSAVFVAILGFGFRGIWLKNKKNGGCDGVLCVLWLKNQKSCDNPPALWNRRATWMTIYSTGQDVELAMSDHSG